MTNRLIEQSQVNSVLVREQINAFVEILCLLKFEFQYFSHLFSSYIIACVLANFLQSLICDLIWDVILLDLNFFDIQAPNFDLRVN